MVRAKHPRTFRAKPALCSRRDGRDKMHIDLAWLEVELYAVTVCDPQKMEILLNGSVHQMTLARAFTASKTSRCSRHLLCRHRCHMYDGLLMPVASRWHRSSPARAGRYMLPVFSGYHRRYNPLATGL